jgi:hypothetical protein
LKKFHKVLLVLLGVIVLTVAGFKAMQPKEPIHHGKRLSVWIMDLWGSNRNAAQAVIQKDEAVFLPFIETSMRASPDTRNSNGLEHFLRSMQAYFNPHPQVIHQAVYFDALELFGTNSIPTYARVLDVPHLSERAAAQLARLGAFEFIETKVLRHASAEARLSACHELGLVTNRKDEAVTLLMQFTHDRDPGVQVAAVASLGVLMTRPAETTPRLIELLETRHDRVRLETIWTLGIFGTNAAAAIPALEKISATGEASFKGTANAALKKIR